MHKKSHQFSCKCLPSKNLKSSGKLDTKGIQTSSKQSKFEINSQTDNLYRTKKPQISQAQIKNSNNHKSDNSFSAEQIKTLFNLYDQYGPKWSDFQELMDDRNQNQLKNKFHSTIRTLCRLIITISEQIQRPTKHICSSKISSKILMNLYEGKKNFKRFKKCMKKMLITMNYQVYHDQKKMIECKYIMPIHNFTDIYHELLKSLGIDREQIVEEIQVKKQQQSYQKIVYDDDHNNMKKSSKEGNELFQQEEVPKQEQLQKNNSVNFPNQRKPQNDGSKNSYRYFSNSNNNNNNNNNNNMGITNSIYSNAYIQMFPCPQFIYFQNETNK